MPFGSLFSHPPGCGLSPPSAPPPPPRPPFPAHSRGPLAPLRSRGSLAPLARVDWRSGRSIHFDIFPGGNVPGEVRFHRILLDLPPPVRAAEGLERGLDGID